ncbi:hypothetical protein AGABI1DRAFT_101874 [Agaricus bisporus var. burnettii JB137-S8]|uniref:2-(3-amino-3-carboxypropyl)histidine synthase subunit 2 n=1 Tax=Agaricus bisporus var. burnettii (strain JB137-S8 / ATCC MYA-4627 / FGSC 10392) TaxID=597362 RepID=K5X213_AGABU|nr:uncharacterized protein AGABI1DRAFT_101874 [Agaricus bisporus var. burnettii JB137-S8]EKM77173.1 hypothetical protein AGABI1DRAFT_101874 [Agaricus bisporus var. burnettii JB137-S8]
MTSTFSTSSENAITRSLNITPDDSSNHLSPEQFDNFYDIEHTTDEIIKGDYKRIALQFPDELLHDSVPVYKRLKSLVGRDRELYVLADTSYGSCCVDEVAAQHINADAIVHYGHACMSLTSRLPVIYVFGKKSVDIEDCVDKLVEAYTSHSSTTSSSPRTALLKYEVCYSHVARDVLQQLQTAFKPLSVDIIHTPLSAKSSSSSTSSNRTPSVAEYNIVFYVGEEESLSLTNILMTHSSCDVFSYNPQTRISKLSSTLTNKMLMRRYATIQKARDADVFGILVGTLGVSSYLSLITHLRKLLASKHKKSYTISVGKLTPSKLANFLEIECFILVACPENTLLLNDTISNRNQQQNGGYSNKDFSFKPIITPFELQLALREEIEWTGKFVLDFEEVIREGEKKKGGNGEAEAEDEDEKEEKDLDEPRFSLITGKYRHPKLYGRPSEKSESQADSSSVILRNQDSSISKLDNNSAAAQYLQQRTYKGLEVRLGEDEPSFLEQGRSGIARGYQTDRHRK